MVQSYPWHSQWQKQRDGITRVGGARRLASTTRYKGWNGLVPHNSLPKETVCFFFLSIYSFCTCVTMVLSSNLVWLHPRCTTLTISYILRYKMTIHKIISSVTNHALLLIIFIFYFLTHIHILSSLLLTLHTRTTCSSHALR